MVYCGRRKEANNNDDNKTFIHNNKEKTNNKKTENRKDYRGKTQICHKEKIQYHLREQNYQSMHARERWAR